MTLLDAASAKPTRSFSPAGETETRIGPLALNAQGLPDQAAIDRLYAERDFQRACQCYLWALPIVAYGQWQNQHETVFGAGDGDVVQYLSVRDKTGIITPNATTPYILGFVNTARTGPVIVEVPAGEIAGGFGDFWERNIADTGATGPDKGKGARYLLLGPGQAPPAGVAYDFEARSPTFNVFHAFRILTTDAAEADRILKGYRLYPASAASPPPTRVVRPEGRRWSGTQPSGMAYWVRLNEMLQIEPVREEDRLIMAMLRSLGLEKGRPFAPTPDQVRALTDGAEIGQLMAIANSFDKRFETARYGTGHWDRAVNVSMGQEAEFYAQLDERASWFYEAVGLSSGMTTKTPGEGQAYLSAYRDTQGQWLDGGRTYRLHVPPDVPAGQWWSVALYDLETRSFMETDYDRAELGSRSDLARNPDGSVDFVFAPEPPKDSPETNWIPTVPGRAWFTYFRLYAPLKPYFDASWVLPDIEAA